MDGWHQIVKGTRCAEEMNYTPIFTPGLTEEEKVAMIYASDAAIFLAKQLGVDCSDVGFTFERDENGNLVPKFTVDGAEEING